MSSETDGSDFSVMEAGGISMGHHPGPTERKKGAQSPFSFWRYLGYQSLSLDTERSRFILMSPCFPSSSRVRRVTRRLVHEWLDDIRANHRLYSTFAAPKHITALNYY